MWGEGEGYEELEGSRREEGTLARVLVNRCDGTCPLVHSVTLQEVPPALFVLSRVKFTRISMKRTNQLYTCFTRMNCSTGYVAPY